MRHLVFASFFLLLTCATRPSLAEDIGNDTVCFVPGSDDCALVAVAEIAKAQRTLDVQQFQMTEPRIAQAIVDAKDRGVAVRLLLDKKAPAERRRSSTRRTAASPCGCCWTRRHLLREMARPQC